LKLEGVVGKKTRDKTQHQRTCDFLAVYSFEHQLRVQSCCSEESHLVIYQVPGPF